MRILDLSGIYEVELEEKQTGTAKLPGTLDENGIGEKECTAEKWHPDAALEEANTGKGQESIITTRFTRKHAWEGVARFQRRLPELSLEKERVFLEIERARKIHLFLNGVEVPEYEKGTLSTPYIFELTSFLREGKSEEENNISILSSNQYEGWPKKAIKYSSAATNETQTNWNGLLGKLQLRVEKENYIKSVQIFPETEYAKVLVEIDARKPDACWVRIESEAFKEMNSKECVLSEGINEIWFDQIAIKPDAKRWDEYEGNLYSLTVQGEGIEEKTVTFGLRVFGDDGAGHLALNGHRIFLRSEANCCVFANTGHMPMDVSEWKEKLLLYKAYGVNCVRFHSHCAPDAAFAAADEIGMLVQPELSNWDPQTALESEEGFAYYQLELKQILHMYGNHPSFCMLTFGNELSCDERGMKHLEQLLTLAHQWDPTRLYAISSNAFYGEKGAHKGSDFYTSSNFHHDMIRGTSAGMIGYINESYPGTKTNYNKVLENIRKSYQKPVFSFEVGQYEILPDFTEIPEFTGVTIPNNLLKVKEEVSAAGFTEHWEEWVNASGELARIAYREEIEAVLRTPEMSGISLLGLQDFPGQGTALVGMINSHFDSKPYEFAKPEKFQSFFRAQLPLLEFEKYTYTTKENFGADILFANYGREDLEGSWSCVLLNGEEEVANYKGEHTLCPHGRLTKVGVCGIPLNQIVKSSKIKVKVCVCGVENEYSIWVYEEGEYTDRTYIDKTKENLDNLGQVITAVSLEEAIPYLEEGKSVFLSPEAIKENFVSSIKTNFTTDFWSVGTFPQQEGYMGCLPKPEHPVFQKFPTDRHADWQWWSLTNSRAMVLPKEVQPLFDVMDSYARLRKLAFMVEANVGNGKLLISSMGLLEKQQYPEVRAMLASIYAYMGSEVFHPNQTLSMKLLKEIMAL